MTCPTCQKKPDPAYRPFCSKRCADVDLGRWLNGSYAVPAAEEFPEIPTDKPGGPDFDTRH